MSPQEIIAAGQGQNYDWSSDRVSVKTQQALTGGRATLVEDTLKPGFHLARHVHKRMTETFYILEGDVEFQFDDETIHATPGMTLNIPPNVWHTVNCAAGGKLLTIFSPGGFDQYMAELAGLTEAQLADDAFMMALAEKYDIWSR